MLSRRNSTLRRRSGNRQRPVRRSSPIRRRRRLLRSSLVRRLRSNRPLQPASRFKLSSRNLRSPPIDTSHLLQLTEELKTELDKAGSNTLSLTAVRKADEVLKLAKALKERMKDRGQVMQSKP